jgi:hypothetical protein
VTDQIEGPDSAAVSATTTSGLVNAWEPQQVDQTAMTVVPDEVGTNLNMTLMPTYDGNLYLNSSVNIGRWMNGTHTLSAYVKWTPAAAAASGVSANATTPSQLPGLVGSINDSGTSTFYSGLIRNSGANQWIIGAEWNCPVPLTYGGGVPVWSKATAVFGDGNYHLLTITRDATLGTVAFYVDGQPAGGGTSGVGSCIDSTYSIGKIERSSLAHPTLPGSLCDVRVYDEVLSPAGVLNLYSSTKALCQ